jgi:hypothetical protein
MPYGGREKQKAPGLATERFRDNHPEVVSGIDRVPTLYCTSGLVVKNFNFFGQPQEVPP